MKACKLCNGGRLVKEHIEPFQSQGYVRCSYCGAVAPIREIVEDYDPKDTKA